MNNTLTVSSSNTLPCSLDTIGRLVSGFGDQSTGQYRQPVLDPSEMAKGLKVTFRPVPRGTKPLLQEFTDRLQRELIAHGVTVLSWEEATFEHHYEVAVPLSKRILKIPARLTHGDIDAVFDLTGRGSLWRKLVRAAMEVAYWTHRRFAGFHRRHRVREILRFVWWSQDYAVKYVSDHVRTQIVSIGALEKFLADPRGDYEAKVVPGLRLMADRLAQMVIGVSKDRLSLLNLNLSDTVYSSSDLSSFVQNSLIPKLHAPIHPLTKGRFEVGTFPSTTNAFAKQAVDLGERIAPLGLLPDAVALANVVRRPSTHDVIQEMVNGRSGISFGFVAYVEPPVYKGPREISATEWEQLQPMNELSSNEVRRNENGRWYLRTVRKGQEVFCQIPDIWIVSSRSGAEKKNLDIAKDLTRIGFTGSLQLQVPDGLDWDNTDIRPSYDTYVMLALALSSAMFQPHLVENGGPLVHFHGYPRADWFRPSEAHIGERNPSVACGTFEAGVFNFASIWLLAERREPLDLAVVIEPDHGCNILAKDMEYLLQRLQEGIDAGTIALGGQNLASLRERRDAS